MKLLGLDVGEKRIGVATADTSVKIAVPLTTINVDGTELDQIATIMRDQGTEAIVVGLPRNSAGVETAQSAFTRAFVERLKKLTPKIRLQDESLTSVIAERRLKDRNEPYEKADIDKEAAALILQDFLETFRRPDPSGNKSKKKPKAMSRLIKAILFVFLAAAVAVVFAISWYSSALKPVDETCGDACPVKSFNITSSEGTEAIANRLEEDGFIRSALAFRVYLLLNDLGGTLKAGVHDLSPGDSAIDIAKALGASPSAATFSLTFLPGETLRDSRRRIIEAGYSAESVDAALTKVYDNPILATKPDNASLEGYIWGDTYEFYSTATPEDIVSRVLSEFESVIKANNLESTFAERGLTLYEGITLASIIQREAHAPDMPGVSQVFLLRLERNIPLGSDAVIAYAADQSDPNRDKTDMSYLTSIGCPWNSRRCTGLPPTPIGNPGLAALKSVGNPTAGTFLYFLTGDDQKMYYAYTESEHNQNIELHCRVLCNYL